MAIPTTAIAGQPADDRLQQLGLTAEELRGAVELGYTHAAGCTNHDPRSLPGTIAWGKATGHLRDIKKPAGWRADHTSNFETTVHPANSHCVAIAAGTSGTGRRDELPPATRTPRGPATSRAVQRNQQLSLGVGTNVFAGTGEQVADPERETWLLLHYFDRVNEEIRLELSCPLELTGTQITRWRERILLDAIPFAADDLDVPFDHDDDSDDQIEIDIERRND
jgi:hypothetical protein